MEIIVILKVHIYLINRKKTPDFLLNILPPTIQTIIRPIHHYNYLKTQVIVLRIPIPIPIPIVSIKKKSTALPVYRRPLNIRKMK